MMKNALLINAAKLAAVGAVSRVPYKIFKALEMRKSQKRCKGELSFFYDENLKVPFEYSDSFFFEAAEVFSRELADLSMVLAMAAFQSSYKDPSIGPLYLEEFFESLDFKCFEANCDYRVLPESDTFGVGAAHKKINVNGKSVTLIALGLRGSGYASEWGGNFNIGRKGSHTGFEICAEKALAFLRDYIRRNDITGYIKIWTSGYSRAAAGANMFGGYLDTLLDRGELLCECTRLSKSDVYIYTFETPKGAAAFSANPRSRLYDNIFNFINKNDAVTLMGPEPMGFDRYGRDIFFPTQGDEGYLDLKKTVMKKYDRYAPSSTLMSFITKNFLDKFSYMYVDFETSTFREMFTNKVTCDQYLNGMVEIMTAELGGREGFMEIQYEFSNVLASLLAADSEKTMETAEKIFKVMSKNTSKLFSLILAQDAAAVISYIGDVIINAMNEVGFALLSTEQVNKLAALVSKYLLELARDFPNETATLIWNTPVFLSYHDPILIWAWLKTLPCDYFDSKLL